MKNLRVRDFKKIIICSVIGLFVLITLFSSFQTIRSGEVGLKVRFGKIVSKGLNEGLNLKIPYIEDIVVVNIKVQKIELTTESSSKDLQTIQTDIAVNYRIESDKAASLYKTVGNNYESTVLDPAIKESIKATIAKYTAAEVITERSEVSAKCMEELQAKVQKYGIVIDNFNITNLSFSDEYTRAIEEKQVAEQKLSKAKLEAEAKLVEAEATKKANDLMRQSLTDNLIAKQFIEKWDGKLPSTYAGENILGLFNLK
ncbi:MAG: prohibitin family protein [Bacilli bacterium]|nr:prohibitin family protein [Bacilli bacterium]